MQGKKEGYLDHQMHLSPHRVITMLQGVTVGDHMGFHAVVFVVILFPLLDPMVAIQGISLHELLERVMMH